MQRCFNNHIDDSNSLIIPMHKDESGTSYIERFLSLFDKIDKFNNYEGIFYCVKCCSPRHFLNITSGNDRCECGSRGWKSDKDYDLLKLKAEFEDNL